MVDREAHVGVLSQSTVRTPCSVFHREMPITKLGMIRIHGPVTNRCLGLSNPLLQAPGSSDRIVNSAIKLNPPNIKILKGIPRAAHDLAARRLAPIIDDVVRENSTSCWDRLFRFSVRCLQAQTLMIREEGDPDQHPSSNRPHRPSQESWESLAARISSKLEEGDFKGAVRLPLPRTPSGTLTRKPSQPSGTNILRPILTRTSPLHPSQASCCR